MTWVGAANQEELTRYVHSLYPSSSPEENGQAERPVTQPKQDTSTPPRDRTPEQPIEADADASDQTDGQTHQQEQPSPSPKESASTGKKGDDVVMVSNVQDVMVVVNKHRELPPDYVPNDLVQPNIPFSFKGDDPKKLMRREAALALEQLFAQAAAENIQLAGVSGYRSYERQKAIFTWNAQQQGAEEANRTSAVPGQSEHQTGLAMDVSSPSVGYALVERFGETTEGKWLAENAPKYGFIIRYPKGKEHITGYSYEPWHLRYVGKEAAQEITAKGLTLEEYIEQKGAGEGKSKS
ncbi:MAG: M15 family metallopeptidase [Brevibacillus sp.]|nr:M15 family metallopeptidase [Brevibacillus sp.]